MSAPSGPPPPNFGQIPLPPGMTLEQFEHLESQLIIIAKINAIAVALICWDYLVLIRHEFALYTSSEPGLWKKPATWSFVILRYTAFLAVVPALWFTSLSTQFCQLAPSLSQVGAVLIVMTSGVIFCFRVFALWNDSKIVKGILGAVYLFNVGCWVAVASQLRATTGPPNPFGSNCQMQPVVSWAPISFASSVFFDAVVLLLTVLKLRKNHGGTRTGIGRQIYRDNLLYFLATAVTNVTVAAFQALPSDQDLLKPMALPFSTVVTVAMAQRVYLNLRLYHKRQANAETSNSTQNSAHSKPPRPNVALSTIPPPPRPSTAEQHKYGGFEMEYMGRRPIHGDSYAQLNHAV